MAMTAEEGLAGPHHVDERLLPRRGEFPLAIAFIDLESLTFAAASNYFIELTGLRAEQVLYRPVSTFIAPTDRRKMIRSLQQLGEHNVEFYATKRELDASIPAEEGSFMWARVWRFDTNDRHFAFCEMNIGPEPKSFQFSENFEHSLHNLVVGLVDRDGYVTDVSPHVREVLGIDAEELVGQKLFSVREEQRVHDLLSEESKDVLTYSLALRLARRGTPSSELEALCVFTALAHSSERCFILSPAANFLHVQRSQRTSQLELHLMRIAQEIHVNRVLDAFDNLRSSADFPPLGQLTPRQWDVMRRLVGGERVATIATALFLSPSAVRNTLSEIFQKFGVHSQVELLDLLSTTQGSNSH